MDSEADGVMIQLKAGVKQRNHPLYTSPFILFILLYSLMQLPEHFIILHLLQLQL